MSKKEPFDAAEFLQEFPAYGCQGCRRKHVFYKERLTPGLVLILRKVALAVEHYNANCIHVSRDLDFDGTPFRLTANDHGNFTKLRQHGLLAQADEAWVRGHRSDVPKNKKGELYWRGYWLITRRGGNLLRGDPIPRSAVVLHNHPIATYPKDGTVTIHDYELDPLHNPLWDDRNYYAGEGRLL